MAGPDYDFFATGPRPTSAPGVPTGGAVSQFGPAVPAFGTPAPGAAAPSYGAPVGGAHALWDPAAALGSHEAAGRRVAAEPARPGTVTAAAVLSLVIGGVMALLACIVLVGWAAASSQVAGLERAGLDRSFTQNLLTGILVGGVVIAAIAAFYVLLGVSTLRGRRWAAWTLLVLSILNSLWGIRAVLEGDSGAGQMVALALEVAIVVLLTLGSGGRWLRRS